MKKKLINSKSWNSFYSARKITPSEFILGNYYFKELFDEIICTNPKSVLEIGIGTGAMSIFLSYLGYRTEGIDIDPKIVKIAAEKNKQFNGNAKFHTMDALNLRFKDKSFDVIFSQGFLEHFNDNQISHLIEEQARVAKKRIVISIPNKNCHLSEFGNENLYSSKKWKSKIKKILELSHIKANLKVYDYQTMLRKDHPFITVTNLVLGRKVETLIVIEMI